MTEPYVPHPQTPGVADHAAPSSYRKPTAKVLSASLVGAPASAVVVGFILWLLDEYVWTTDPIPDPVIALVGLVVPIVGTFVAGYLKKVSPEDRAAVKEGRL